MQSLRFKDRMGLDEVSKIMSATHSAHGLQSLANKHLAVTICPEIYKGQWRTNRPNTMQQIIDLAVSEKGCVVLCPNAIHVVTHHSYPASVYTLKKELSGGQGIGIVRFTNYRTLVLLVVDAGRLRIISSSKKPQLSADGEEEGDDVEARKGDADVGDGGPTLAGRDRMTKMVLHTVTTHGSFSCNPKKRVTLCKELVGKRQTSRWFILAEQCTLHGICVDKHCNITVKKLVRLSDEIVDISISVDGEEIILLMCGHILECRTFTNPSHLCTSYAFSIPIGLEPRCIAVCPPMGGLNVCERLK